MHTHQQTELPPPPATVFGDSIRLHFSHLAPGNPAFGLVPSYHFQILDPDGKDAGHINFRVGNTPHIILVAGHIGYEIISSQRGNGYAEKACRALAPFIARIYRDVVITANPDNLVSIHIIEKLGARFLNEIVVPKDDPAYANGARLKRRYCWQPGCLT